MREPLVRAVCAERDSNVSLSDLLAVASLAFTSFPSPSIVHKLSFLLVSSSWNVFFTVLASLSTLVVDSNPAKQVVIWWTNEEVSLPHLSTKKHSMFSLAGFNEVRVKLKHTKYNKITVKQVANYYLST